jgi:hypothetical protein
MNGFEWQNDWPDVISFLRKCPQDYYSMRFLEVTCEYDDSAGSFELAVMILGFGFEWVHYYSQVSQEVSSDHTREYRSLKGDDIVKDTQDDSQVTQ